MLKLPGAPGALRDPALDQERLYALGLDHVRDLARRVWTDHNVHDPGITTLELLCYALTDLAYRASFPVEDLLAGDGGGAGPAQFFTARRILPSAPLTLLDYRKLLIDLDDIKNAWIDPEPRTLYADPATRTLASTHPGTPGIREVHVQGLYRVRVELMDDVDAAREAAALAAAMRELHAHRNLCDEFVRIEKIEKQPFIVCGEIEIDPQAVTVEVQAQVVFRIEQYLSPPVFHHTLDELLARRKADGGPWTPEDIFEGPALDHGFIPDAELAAADLRTEVRLSDVISIIMDVPGVRAVRDLLINPVGTTASLPDRWVVPVAAGKQPTLDRGRTRLVLYKRNLPVPPRPADVEARYQELAREVRERQETRPAGARDDLEVPAGRDRRLGRYHSFQNHFPAVYGIGEHGLPGGAGPAREALALQLEGYLLFFDQLMADYCAQLAHVKELFSTDETVKQTYFHQVVDSFRDWSRIYAAPPAGRTLLQELERLDDSAAQIERRNRFLDHLVARFAERFHEYAAVTALSLGATPERLLRVKCDFLGSYDEISRDRGLGYDDTVAPLWDTANVSGVERRVARLLGMPAATRRDLGHPELTPPPGAGEPDPDEGVLLIENQLLRTADWGAPYLPFCGDPDCADCAGNDPYSYRVHVLLPAYAPRFAMMDFRRFVEDVVRQEMPAHVVPRICWVGKDDMAAIEQAYRAWLVARAADASDTADQLRELVTVLYAAKNVYPGGRLLPCVPGDERPKFQLGRTVLGKDGES